MDNGLETVLIPPLQSFVDLAFSIPTRTIENRESALAIILFLVLVFLFKPIRNFLKIIWELVINFVIF